MKPKTAVFIAFCLALLNEATYEFMSEYESWIIGLVIGVISGLFIFTAKTSRKR